MKIVSRIALLSFFCFIALPAAALDLLTNNPNNTPGQNNEVVKTLKHLGLYMGFDLSNPPPPDKGSTVFKPEDKLLFPGMQIAAYSIYFTALGALPVNAISKALAAFVPPSIKGAELMNNQANATFIAQKYGSPEAAANGKVSVTKLIDQKDYQPDPVNQAILNILGTPDDSYCLDNNGSTWKEDCPATTQTQVMTKVLGKLPGTNEFFDYKYNKDVISQLNSNALLGPLTYNDENSNQNTGSLIPGQEQKQLVAQNQAQQAGNFIRYATGAVAPGNLPKQSIYQGLYDKATSTDNNASAQDKIQAQSTLANYLSNMRVFAAQSSVGIGNLYFLLSKRLPQKPPTEKEATSQAMTEFRMATRRLFDGTVKEDTWINKINHASSASVQKEIALLLAEMNYQMYLDRQLQERILLTNSIMLIQNTRAAQPTADFAGGSLEPPAPTE